MQAAGFHFGHDAGGALVDAGGLVKFLDKERRTRVKHALGLSAADLREVLENAPEAMLLGLSSTQELPIFHEPAVELSIEGASRVGMAEYMGRVTADHHYHKFLKWLPDYADHKGLHVSEQVFGYMSRLNEGFNRSYEALGGVSGQLQGMAGAQSRTASLTLDGRRYDARFYQHHYLHAYYAAWAASPTRPALILTGDGGIGPTWFGGGIYFWAPGQKLLPVTPADAWLGFFYDTVAVTLGFDASGGAGKLMGLAPYGRPIYFDDALVGTRWQVTDGYELSPQKVIQRWLARFGIDATALPKWDPFSEGPPVLIADIAASAQLILEKNILELGKAALRIARRAGFPFEALVLSGGVALNCPANSNLAVSLDKPVLAPPAVNDEGLAIGAAVAAYFDLAGKEPAPPASYAACAYIGTDVGEADVAAAAAKYRWTRREDDALATTVALLLADEAVGLCSGRSEVGPRALGHRSILINAASTETWRIANQIKRREPWRPFAPAVLAEDAAAWFDRGPAESRFMLFNYRCTTKRLPAITHYDHSARVQHVSAETGLLYDLLQALKRTGAPPVVLNTSFNGPGVPIVDTADDAFAEATRLGLRHILTDFGLYSGPAAT
jgi:carbamoyltransferase